MSYEDIKLEDNMLFEIRMCLNIFNSKGGCKFNGGIKCSECGTIPLLLKMIEGKVSHEKLEELICSNNKLRKLNNIK